MALGIYFEILLLSLAKIKVKESGFAPAINEDCPNVRGSAKKGEGDPLSWHKAVTSICHFYFSIFFIALFTFLQKFSLLLLKFAY